MEAILFKALKAVPHLLLTKLTIQRVQKIGIGKNQNTTTQSNINNKLIVK